MIYKREILCIHYYYPPIRSGGVIRNYFFSCEFAKMFDKVHVITTSNVDIMEQEWMPIPQNVVVYKAKTNDFRSVLKSKNHFSESVKGSKVVDVYLKLKKTLPFHFLIGEGGIRYAHSARRIGQEIINNNPITHLYSSFMPYVDHKVASKLKEKNLGIKWIADFRDLQVEPIYKNIYFPSWNKIQERRLLANSDLITTVSEGLAKSLSLINDRVLSIPRGIEYSEFSGDRYDQFTIAYTGNLYKQFRDGRSFVKELAMTIEMNLLTDVRFVYAGRDSQQWVTWFEEFDILDKLDDRGFVSKAESREIQHRSHVLLLLSSSSKEQQGVLTGKLFEYLETSNPILNFLNGVRDLEFERFFEQLDAGEVIYSDDAHGLRELLVKNYESWMNGVANRISKHGVAARKALTWESRAKKMIDAVK